MVGIAFNFYLFVKSANFFHPLLLNMLGVHTQTDKYLVYLSQPAYHFIYVQQRYLPTYWFSKFVCHFIYEQQRYLLTYWFSNLWLMVSFVDPPAINYAMRPPPINYSTHPRHTTLTSGDTPVVSASAAAGSTVVAQVATATSSTVDGQVSRLSTNDVSQVTQSPAVCPGIRSVRKSGLVRSFDPQGPRP